MLYRYVKAPPAAVSVSLTPWRLAPLTLIFIGLITLSSVLVPLIYHELIISPRLRRLTILSPLPLTTGEAEQLTRIAGVSTAPTDLTQASNWFPAAPQAQPSKITHYNISIPTLNIDRAIVAVGGEDLKKSLIQYGGTALPGEFGTPVIFGHSILRQFYNPSINNPNRYMSIFSTIMTLKPGDTIEVNFDGIEYTYNVVDKYEVQPEDVSVLRQSYDRKTLKLITCVPEGTYLRRGIIEAQLVAT